MFDEDVKQMVARTILCFAATTNEDGSPNLSPKSSLRVHDDNHLMFANMASPGTVANLRRDPRIEINCVDIFARRGYRFVGRATVHSGDDPLYRALRTDIAAEHGDAIPVFDAVLIEVQQVHAVISPAYTFIDGVTEDVLRNAYLGKYGVRPAEGEAAE
jgi:predicted pyridoxine 5'-phosphate oxidase superfamily flavin-nucleotide-binding protein